MVHGFKVNVTFILLYKTFNLISQKQIMELLLQIRMAFSNEISFLF